MAKDSADFTLHTADGYSARVLKSVLISKGGNFFKTLLKYNDESVVLHGIEGATLKHVLDFINDGRIRIFDPDKICEYLSICNYLLLTDLAVELSNCVKQHITTRNRAPLYTTTLMMPLFADLNRFIDIYFRLDFDRVVKDTDPEELPFPELCRLVDSEQLNVANTKLISRLISEKWNTYLPRERLEDKSKVSVRLRVRNREKATTIEFDDGGRAIARMSAFRTNYVHVIQSKVYVFGYLDDCKMASYAFDILDREWSEISHPSRNDYRLKFYSIHEDLYAMYPSVRDRLSGAVLKYNPTYDDWILCHRIHGHYDIATVFENKLYIATRAHEYSMRLDCVDYPLCKQGLTRFRSCCCGSYAFVGHQSKLYYFGGLCQGAANGAVTVFDVEKKTTTNLRKPPDYGYDTEVEVRENKLVVLNPP